MDLKFKCPRCGYDRLASIEENAVVISEITKLDSEGDFEYRSSEIDSDGAEYYFECRQCGLVVRDDHDNVVRSNLDLVKWLKSNCPQEVKAQPVEFSRIKDNACITNSSFLVSISAPYDRIVSLFGEPDCFDSYKTDAEWIVQNKQGQVFCIYNYKDGKNYLGEEGTPTEEIEHWHIGGFSSHGLDGLCALLSQNN